MVNKSSALAVYFNFGIAIVYVVLFFLCLLFLINPRNSYNSENEVLN